MAAGVDAIVVDTAHGHSHGVIERVLQGQPLGTRQGMQLNAIILDQWVPGDDACQLIEELKTRRQLEAVGGFPYLIQVTGKIPTTAQAGYFIETVRTKWVLRRWITCAWWAIW